MSKQIALSKGLYATVDDQDYDWLSELTWYATSHNYATNKKLTAMHRAIMERCGHQIKGLFIDHINGNRLDNRRENLRICNPKQNGANSRKIAPATSQYKGVSWHKQSKRWQAIIRIDGVSKYLGLFNFEDDAAVAYNDAARKAWGEFAYLNTVTVEPRQSQTNPAGAGRIEINIDDYKLALDHALNALNAPNYGYYIPDLARIHLAETQPSGKPVKAFTIVGVVMSELW